MQADLFRKLLGLVASAAISAGLGTKTGAVGADPAPWSVRDTIAIREVPGTLPDGQGPQFIYSSDRSLAAFVVVKAELGTRDRTATLQVFRTSDLRNYANHGAKIVPVLRYSLISSANGPAIRDLQWAPVGETLGFVAGRRARCAFYTWSPHTRLRRIATSSREIVHFRFLGHSGKVALVVSEPRTPTPTRRSVSAGGLLVSLGYRAPDGMEGSRPHELAIVSMQGGRIQYLHVTLAGYLLWPSPDGRYIGFWKPLNVTWGAGCWRWARKELGSNSLLPWTHRDSVEDAIFDVVAKKTSSPFGGPLAFVANQFATVIGNSQTAFPGIVWSANSKTAVAPFTFSGIDQCEQNRPGLARIRTMALREGAGRASVVATLANLKPGQGNPYSNLITYKVWLDGAGFSGVVQEQVAQKSTQVVAFHLVGNSAWKSQVSNTDALSKHSPDREPAILAVAQDYESPPEIVVRTQMESRRLVDLAPHVRGKSLGLVREFHWVDGLGSVCSGLLLFPNAYVPGQRLPLVIQTHGFAEHEFYAGGPSGTLFPGRALADQGFVVLATREVPSYIFDGHEAEKMVGTYIAAIDKLADEGLIDRHRVGVVGYSRTTTYIDYALTFHRDLFAAAVAGDGDDEGYDAYLSYVDYGRASDAWQFGTVYGPGGPWDHWPNWFRRAPDLNAGAEETPLLMEADSGYGMTALMWPTYAAFKSNNVAVELWTIPNGIHNLVRPIDQEDSEQGSLDWLRFWLQGYEDPAPAKRSMYDRWRTMREDRRRRQRND